MCWHSQVYSVPGSYNWTVPDTVSAVMAIIQGAGAGGSGNGTINSASQCGGGNGELLSGIMVPCTPGGTLSIVVGAGGVGRSTDWTDSSSNPGAAKAVEGGGGNSSVGRAIALGAPDYLNGGGYGAESKGGGPNGAPAQAGGSDGLRGTRENLLWWGGACETSAVTDGDTTRTFYGSGDGGRLVGGAAGPASGALFSRLGGATSANIWATGVNGGATTNVDGTNAPATSYGVGGSGTGQNTVGPPTRELVGGNGAGGYVAIFWVKP